jgi:uncharacterized phage protein (TIGR01671 family)
MREIKFRIIHKGKISGYERLKNCSWEWNWIKLNPDKGERWSAGVIEEIGGLIRNQFTGRKDKNGREIYEGDIMSGPFLNSRAGRKKIKKFSIIYHERTSKFAIKLFEGDSTGAFGLIPSLEDCEVIGNIYQPSTE